MNKTIRIICTKSNNVDGSIGNSVFKWAQGYYINYKLGFEYTILLQHEVWSELNLLEFPYTKTIEGDLTEGAFRIDISHLKDMFLHNNVDELKSHDHLYLDDWHIFDGPSIKYMENGELLTTHIQYDSIDPLRLIKFKNENIENFFKEEFNDFVSIHIRRYCGVIIGEKQLATLPKEIVCDFYRDYLKNSLPYISGWKDIKDTKTVYVHPFIPDSQYYRTIEEILQYDINQKFYISTDIPRQYYQYYKEKYRNIFDKYDYFDKFEKIVKENCDKVLNFDPNTLPNSVLNTYKNPEYLLYANLLDIFAMCNSKLIVQSYFSSWGRMCRRIRNTEEVILPLCRENDVTTPAKFFDTIRRVYGNKFKESEIKLLIQNVIEEW